MANPKYTQAEKEAVIAAALQSIATGQSLNAFCKANKYPYKTVYDWLVDDSTNSAYVRAKSDGTHYLANEAIDILDAVDQEIRDKQLEGPIANAYISAAKARADIRLRLIGKWNRKDYGEKQEVDHTSSDGSMSEKPTIIKLVAGKADDNSDD